MLDENQMVHPGRPGDDGDAALDAALAAADDDMLSAISNGLDLDMGLARILGDLGGSPAAPQDIRAPAYPGEDRRIPDAISPDRSSRIQAQGAEAASPIRVARLIHDVNASDQAAQDQFLRTRQAVGVALRSQHAAEQAAAEAGQAEVAHRVIQAGQPHRRAPLPRQVLLALVTVVPDGLACYLAAQALGGSPDATLAWTGLFLAVLTGGQAALGFCGDRARRALVLLTGFIVILLGTLCFWFLAATGTGGPMPAIAGACLFTVAAAGSLTLGYRALRAAETPSAWRARRQACTARAAARIARAAAGQDTAERDRLIDTYLRHVRPQVLKTCPAGQQLAMESGIRKHLLGEGRMGELEAWCPSRAPLPERPAGVRTGHWITRWIPAR
jgi:hypothetical protein